MKYKKLYFILIFAFFAIILLNSKSYAGSLNLDSLDYDVTLNSDGTANVKETWVIDIKDTNTLFKNFKIDNTKYTEITDVSVVETTSGNRKSFTKQNIWQYHVYKDCYYALVNSDGKFEIAWGVDEDGATRTFEISYKIIDAIKNYNDCSEFYWQFIDTTSEIPADKVTGKIHLPNSNVDVENIRVWSHGPLNGTIFKKSNSEVVFEVENLEENTMLEARVVTPTDVFHYNTNKSSQNKLNSILAQEEEWANEANRMRAISKAKTFMIISFFILTNIGGIVLAILLIKKIFKYKLALKEAPNIKPSNPQKYFRDIPNKDSTPAQAGFLYYFNNTGLNSNLSRVISATLLDLCMKKCISFNVPPDKSKDINITLNGIENINLSEDEKTIYNSLLKVSSNIQSSTIRLKDFKKYYQSHSSEFLNICEKINNQVENIQILYGNYDKNSTIMYNKWIKNCSLFILLVIFGYMLFVACIIPSIILSIYAYKIAKRYKTLTQKGVDEKELWVGLKNYMEDFSLLKEKEVPDLILWEKYLIYATTFGIAEKVLKQLKDVYPQITDYSYMSTHGYTYLYFLYYGNVNGSFISNISNSISGVYNSTHYSSGSGAGGGFSGGGGFGGGGGRNGWQIKLIIKVSTYYIQKNIVNIKITMFFVF